MSFSEATPFDMEMDLQEDIGSELDYFILLTLLGIDDEAQDFAFGVLWPHLQHFPVFAEIANYFVGLNNIGSLKRLLDHIGELDVQFQDPEEDLFLTYMRLIEVNQAAYAHQWYQSITDLTKEFNGWTSETSCLILEVKMTVATRSLDGSLFGFLLNITDYCLQLQRRGMFEQAARIFWIACSAAVERFTLNDDDYLPKVLSQLSSYLQEDSDRAEHSRDSNDADNRLIYTLLNQISLLTVLWKVTSAALETIPNLPPQEVLEEIKELLQTIEGPLRQVFEALPNPAPRGSRVAFCESLRSKLEEINLTTRVAEHHHRIPESLTGKGWSSDEDLATKFRSHPDSIKAKDRSPPAFKHDSSTYDPHESFKRKDVGINPPIDEKAKTKSSGGLKNLLRIGSKRSSQNVRENLPSDKMLQERSRLPPYPATARRASGYG